MKSEFYREISQEQKTRKSTAKNKIRKDMQGGELINPMKMNKVMKSVQRGQIHSIDVSKRMKIDHDQSMLRISFSRPLLREEEGIQAETNHEVFCVECQSMRVEHDKSLRQLKMHYQEEVTDLKEKYILMQKKYLYKENELIKLSNDHINLLDSYGQVEDKLKDSLIEIEDLKEKCFNNEEEIVRLLQDIKKYQDQNKFFNHFLSVFVEQTKCMINWCKLFEKTCDQLPTFITQVKEDLFCRKVDLDLMLKQSINYKNSNFGTQTIKEIDSSSCFFGSEEDNSTTFMKYFKQFNNEEKNRGGKFFPKTQIKERGYDLNSFSVNKQNIDTANRPSAFESLIQSRLNQKLLKHKTSKSNDDFFRILLAQAQTIESNSQWRYSSRKSHSNDINVSLLSSITKQVDFDIY